MKDDPEDNPIADAIRDGAATIAFAIFIALMLHGCIAR